MEIALVVCILGGLGVLIAGTVWLMRNRAQAREIGREAEARNVITDDTRRGFWRSSASDAGDSDGGGGDGSSD